MENSNTNDKTNRGEATCDRLAGSAPEGVSRVSEKQGEPRREGDPLASAQARDSRIKLLEYIFDTLCSLRLTAKSYNHGFLSYLIEMAALETQSIIKEARAEADAQRSELKDEHTKIAKTMPKRASLK